MKLREVRSRRAMLTEREIPASELCSFKIFAFSVKSDGCAARSTSTEEGWEEV